MREIQAVISQHPSGVAISPAGSARTGRRSNTQ